METCAPAVRCLELLVPAAYVLPPAIAASAPRELAVLLDVAAELCALAAARSERAAGAEAFATALELLERRLGASHAEALVRAAADAAGLRDALEATRLAETRMRVELECRDAAHTAEVRRLAGDATSRRLLDLSEHEAACAEAHRRGRDEAATASHADAEAHSARLADAVERASGAERRAAEAHALAHREGFEEACRMYRPRHDAVEQARGELVERTERVHALEQRIMELLAPNARGEAGEACTRAILEEAGHEVLDTSRGDFKNSGEYLDLVATVGGVRVAIENKLCRAISSRYIEEFEGKALAGARRGHFDAAIFLSTQAPIPKQAATCAMRVVRITGVDGAAGSLPLSTFGCARPAAQEIRMHVEDVAAFVQLQRAEDARTERHGRALGDDAETKAGLRDYFVGVQERFRARSAELAAERIALDRRCADALGEYRRAVRMSDELAAIVAFEPDGRLPRLAVDEAIEHTCSALLQSGKPLTRASVCGRNRVGVAAAFGDDAILACVRSEFEQLASQKRPKL